MNRILEYLQQKTPKPKTRSWLVSLILVLTPFIFLLSFIFCVLLKS